MAGEDSGEAEFTPAQKSTEARALVTRRRAERRSSSTCQRRGEKLIRERPFTVGLARLGYMPSQPGAASGVARWPENRAKGSHCQGHRGLSFQPGAAP